MNQLAIQTANSQLSFLPGAPSSTADQPRYLGGMDRAFNVQLSTAAFMPPGLRGRCWTGVSQLPCAWEPGPANSTSPRSTLAAKFSRSSRIMRSGLDIASATTSPTLPPGGSA